MNDTLTMAKAVRVRSLHNKYKVYSNGKIWSNSRGRYMKPSRCGHCAWIKLNGKQVIVHKLISDLFLPRSEFVHLFVNTITHLDGNPLNNDVSNLKWVKWRDVVKPIKRA